jgi:diguanylate cyclase (GGDEF)-like protein/PAS domain S-box-containing protein
VVGEPVVRQPVVRQPLVRQPVVREPVGVSPPEHVRARRVGLFIAFVVMVAVAALAAAVLLTGRGDHEWLLLAGFAVALTAAEIRPIHLVHRDESEALQVEEAFFVPMAFLFTPFEAMALVAMAVAIASTTWRRGVRKSVFNTAMMTGSFGAGLATAHAIGFSAPLGFGDVTALITGGLVTSVVSTVVVSVIISLAQGVPIRSVLLDGTLVRSAICVGSLSLGVLVVLAAEQRLVALVASAVPVIVLQYAYSGALRQWRERRQAEALYQAARRIHATVSSSQVRDELLRASRDLLAARSASVVDAAIVSEPTTALRVPLDESSVVELADPATGGRWTGDDRRRLEALVAVAKGALDNALLYEQLQAITRSLGEGVLALDASGVITFANPAAEALLGWRSGDLTGRDIAAAVDPSGRSLIASDRGEWVHLPRLRGGDTVRLEEHVVVRADGKALDVALTASPVVRDGDVAGVVVAFRDVTERKALERRLVHQAFHDPLTGLPNRALFLDRLEHARLRSREAGTTQAVLFVDLDRFKLINDSLGHRAGDDVLCTVASRMVGVLREGDTVARFGGDEFTVLLEEVSGPAEATAAAERIMHALRLPLVAGDREVVLTASIGIAVAEPGNAPSDLLAAADIAMYESKSSGKDRWTIATADADDRALARLDLEMELRRALSNDELEVHYQPVVRADGGELYGLEALVRWRHPTLGLLAPGSFMTLAEDTGLVLPLGDWVLERACRDAKSWHDRHPGCAAVVAVNLSARQFQQPDLRDRVADVLRRTGLDPSKLVLEITETVVMQDTERVLSTLHSLRSLRVKLAVDDFGTGFSSLSYLKRFPIDTVKIDKSFVDGLASSAVDREIVAAVVRLAAAVGMHTVAEGVETTAQLDQLRLLGCSAVQGFLVAAPQPIADLERLLEGSRAAFGSSRARERRPGAPAPRREHDVLPARS